MKKKIIIIVTGGRSFHDYDFVCKIMNKIQSKFIIKLIRHGNAKGLDKLVDRWAKENSVQHKPYDVDWTKYGNRRAGHVRNVDMARDGAHLCVVFPGGGGTLGMEMIAKLYGIKTVRAIDINKGGFD